MIRQIVFGVLFSAAALAQTQTISLSTLDAVTLNKVGAQAATFKGKPALHVTDVAGVAANEDRLAIVKGVDFQDGTLEIELSGAPGAGAGAAARGFVGLAFRVAPGASKYECVYLRPTNGRADDQLRRNHSVQYISFPDFPWEKLREQTPSKYETYADMAPGEWLKLKIEVKGAKARIWVNDAAQPTMLVNDLKLGEARGGVALWIGPGTDAHFSNLKITR